MTEITAAAQAEADARWPANHIVDDPFGETGWAYSDEYGYDETANKAFVQGAEWAMNQKREITDAMIQAAAMAIHELVESGTPWSETTGNQRNLRRVEARAALEAAEQAQ